MKYTYADLKAMYDTSKEACFTEVGQNTLPRSMFDDGINKEEEQGHHIRMQVLGRLMNNYITEFDKDHKIKETVLTLMKEKEPNQ